MRIAIPVVNGMLCSHFGHCKDFVLIDVDVDTNAIQSEETVEAPPHQPGLLPVWLAEKGVRVVIAGGMGNRAQAIFNQQGVETVVGVAAGSPEDIVEAYLDGRLETGGNLCDH